MPTKNGIEYNLNVSPYNAHGGVWSSSFPALFICRSFKTSWKAVSNG